MVQTRNNAKAGAEATLSQNNDNTLVSVTELPAAVPAGCHLFVQYRPYTPAHTLFCMHVSWQQTETCSPLPASPHSQVDKLAGDLSKMAVGVGKKSYHMTSKGFAVYENLQGAVTSTGEGGCPT